ncbi:1398_t:CDS:2 [Dentiscutata heterogama]|uniref:1398_t:CDS:1 n=1 Tax=Dentiscutata heterogama TaxID=1316150 RepID=A0ACA9KSJ0_9GLOM|nr:1398_t:CDS:2 [Dentiscutata heterogama]
MASDVEAKDSKLQEEQDKKVDPSPAEEPEMTQEVQIMNDDDASDTVVLDTNEEKSPTTPTEKRKREEQSTKDKESDESVEQPPTKRTRTSTRKMSSTVSKRKQTSTSGQSSPKRGRGRKPSIKFEDEIESDELRKGGQSTKKKSAWKVEEDSYMVDCILEEMPSPSWKRIAKGLPGRTPNSCLVRWKTLQKRLYQNL